MKNRLSSTQIKIDSSKLVNNKFYNQNKITDVNILLNRVKIDQKNERNKKIIFSISASLGLLVFGIIVF